MPTPGAGNSDGRQRRQTLRGITTLPRRDQHAQRTATLEHGQRNRGACSGLLETDRVLRAPCVPAACLMSPHHGGIHTQRPVHLTGGIGSPAAARSERAPTCPPRPTGRNETALLCHEPNRSGTSRHGQLVRSLKIMPSTTCRCSRHRPPHCGVTCGNIGSDRAHSRSDNSPYDTPDQRLSTLVAFPPINCLRSQRSAWDRSRFRAHRLPVSEASAIRTGLDHDSKLPPESGRHDGGSGRDSAGLQQGLTALDRRRRLPLARATPPPYPAPHALSEGITGPVSPSRRRDTSWRTTTRVRQRSMGRPHRVRGTLGIHDRPVVQLS